MFFFFALFLSTLSVWEGRGGEGRGGEGGRGGGEGGDFLPCGKFGRFIPCRGTPAKNFHGLFLFQYPIVDDVSEQCDKRIYES
uniref:Secreted protein n=1 Tax=Ixodes scapularis TaxID=6945 RepID=A0A4D5RBN5_IXOSC